MTREERKKAIELLDNLRGMVEDNQGNDYDFAIQKAIEAIKQEPCEDTVSKASVFEILGNLMAIPYDFDRQITPKDVSESMIEVRDLPSVEPVSCVATVKFSREDLQVIVDKKVKELTGERKKGRWIESESYPGKWYCSECGGIHHDTETDEWREVFDFRYAYCPLCGIEMENKG